MLRLICSIEGEHPVFVSHNQRALVKKYLNNRLFKIGAIIALIGWTPLLAILLLASGGLWPDPDPNPIGPGLLFVVTFWPAVICLQIGAVQVWRGRQ
jgi:hypothetical protein